MRRLACGIGVKDLHSRHDGPPPRKLFEVSTHLWIASVLRRPGAVCSLSLAILRPPDVLVLFARLHQDLTGRWLAGFMRAVLGSGVGAPRALVARRSPASLWSWGPNRRAQERERAAERKAAVDAREVISRAERSARSARAPDLDPGRDDRNRHRVRIGGGVGAGHLAGFDWNVGYRASYCADREMKAPSAKFTHDPR